MISAKYTKTAYPFEIISFGFYVDIVDIRVPVDFLMSSTEVVVADFRRSTGSSLIRSSLSTKSGSWYFKVPCKILELYSITMLS